MITVLAKSCCQVKLKKSSAATISWTNSLTSVLTFSSQVIFQNFINMKKTSDKKFIYRFEFQPFTNKFASLIKYFFDTLGNIVKKTTRILFCANNVLKSRLYQCCKSTALFKRFISSQILSVVLLKDA